MQNTVLKTLFLALLSFASAGAFVVPSQHATRTTTNIINNNNNIQLQATKQPQEMIPAHVKAAAFATLVIISQPLLALAEDDYEYGAVDAPNFVPIVGGLLAILTALLPIALRGGEEAFEEMKKTDGFGSGQDKLKSPPQEFTN